MKRIHWWTLLGVAAISLAATLAGQSVWGQPDEKKPSISVPTGFLPKPVIVDARPELPESNGNPTPSETALAQEGTANPPLQIKNEDQPLPSFQQSSPAAGTPTRNPEVPSPGAAPQQLFPKNADVPLMGQFPKGNKDPLDSAGDIRPGRQQPAVSIDWIGPLTARVNQAVACQLIVRNTSTGPVQNVVVRQRLPEGVVCKGSEPQAMNDVGELVWNLGTMAPEQSRRIDVKLVCQSRGPVNCLASVTFTGAALHQLVVREPQLAVKMRTPEKVVAGEPVTLLFAVSNPGDGVAEAVKIRVLLPDGLESVRGKVVEVDVHNLAPKEIRTMQLLCTAKGCGPQKCMVTATADGGISSSDTMQLNILTPKLEVAMTGPRLRYLDRHAIYVFKVSNPGSAPATGVEVRNVIPAGFKFHQANHGGQYQDATKMVSWNLGDLPPGQTREVAIEVVPIEAGEHRVAAQAKSSRGLKSQTEMRTVVEGLPSLMIELSDMDDPIEVGAETAYELKVSNSGTKMETNVEVVCTLPDQLEFRGAKCSTTLRYGIEGRELIFEPLPRLAPKAEVIYRIQVKGIAPGDVRFRTRIRADDLREPIVREERTRIYSDDAPLRGASNPIAAPNVPASPVGIQTNAPVQPKREVPLDVVSTPAPNKQPSLPTEKVMPVSFPPTLPAPKGPGTGNPPSPLPVIGPPPITPASAPLPLPTGPASSTGSAPSPLPVIGPLPTVAAGQPAALPSGPVPSGPLPILPDMPRVGAGAPTLPSALPPLLPVPQK